MEMLNQILNLPWVYAALILTFSFISIAIICLFITRQFFSCKTLRAHHDVAGYTFGIVGMIYAVLLGFIVVQSNERFQQAEQSIIHETVLLADLFRDVEVFEELHKRKLQQLIRDYASAVHDVEWGMMAEQKESEVARSLFTQIWQEIQELNPRNEKEIVWYGIALGKLNDLGKERITRLFNMHESLGAMMWTLLLIGAFNIVFFMCFFSAESFSAQVAMTVLLAGMIAFMLFLIQSLDSIYWGDIGVYPSSLRQEIERFDAAIHLSFRDKP